MKAHRECRSFFSTVKFPSLKSQGLVVQRADNAIQRINRFLADKSKQNVRRTLSDSIFLIFSISLSFFVIQFLCGLHFSFFNFMRKYEKHYFEHLVFRTKINSTWIIFPTVWQWEDEEALYKNTVKLLVQRNLVTIQSSYLWVGTAPSTNGHYLSLGRVGEFGRGFRS